MGSPPASTALRSSLPRNLQRPSSALSAAHRISVWLGIVVTTCPAAEPGPDRSYGAAFRPGRR